MRHDLNVLLQLPTYANKWHKSVKILSSVTLVALNVLFCLRRLERNSFIATFMASDLAKIFWVTKTECYQKFHVVEWLC